MGQIRGPVDCARALCMALDYTFGSGRRGRYRGGFFLAPGAPDQHSTGPRLPRAGCLAIWPGAPGAKKKAVLNLPTYFIFL